MTHLGYFPTLERQRCDEGHGVVDQVAPVLPVDRAFVGERGRSHALLNTAGVSFAERQTHVSPSVSVVFGDRGRGPVASTSSDEVAQDDSFEISSHGCKVRQDGCHRFGAPAPRRFADRRLPPARRACRKYAVSTTLPAGVVWLQQGLRRGHKATLSKFRLTDAKSVRTDVIDLERQRLGNSQPAGCHQTEERVESMRSQRPCRRELFGFSKDCGEFCWCENMRSRA